MELQRNEICRNVFKLVQRNLRVLKAGQKPYKIKDDQGAVEVFKSLQKIIPDGIIRQIEGINKLFHCIFITGADFDLITGIASYIYNTHAARSFTHLSYSGHTNQEIISDLFPPTPTFKLNYYLRGRTLFISGLGIEHQLVFKRLLGAFREINPPIGLGYLIIDVGNADTLPPGLVSLSDVIRLEPVTQALVTPKDIHYDDRKGKLFVDKISANLTPTEKVFFEYFWDHENITVTVDDIIEHMITSGGASNASWDRGYFGKTLSSVNCKGKSLGVEKLIRNVERGRKEYEISIRVIKKIFKP